MNVKNNRIPLFQTIKAESGEECFLLNGERVELSLLPGEHRKVQISGRKLLRLDRSSPLIGISGAGPVVHSGASYGAWGSFQCILASADRFVRCNAAGLAAGKSPNAILSEQFRPILTEALARLERGKRNWNGFEETLEPLLRDEATRQGMELVCFKTEYFGYVHGGCANGNGFDYS